MASGIGIDEVDVAQLSGPEVRALVRAGRWRRPTVGMARGWVQANLAVLPVRGVRWTDWGDPARVVSTLAELGHRPAWVEHMTSAAV